jgi:hypothetical protein
VVSAGGTVLGIKVDAGLLDQWRDWLMPAVQPFLVPREVANAAGLADDSGRLSFELTDTFGLYDTGGQAVCWLTRAESRRLPALVRRDQSAPHRWPSADLTRDIARTVRFVEEGRRRSRQADVDEGTWRKAAPLLPDARGLAGTFPPGSGRTASER